MTATTVPDTRAAGDPGAAALLVDIRGLAALLSRSVASLERDQAAGRVPAPVYVGGSKRWRRAEVEAWVAAGCPRRDRWEAARAGGG